jgi:prepilin-type N-terminal cleavage/methylation domain-containing protein
MNNERTQHINSQSGFSMMELLIVMVVMLIIIGATFSLLHGSMKVANTNYEVTTAAQGLRNSQEFLNRDILVAGDGMRGISNVWLPTLFVTNYLSARSATDIDPSNRGYISIGAIISDNDVAGGKAVKDSNPSVNVLPNSDRLTMLAVDPAFSAIDIPVGGSNKMTGEIRIPPSRINKFHIGEIYYITSGGTGAFGTVTNVNAAGNTITWGEGDRFGLNRLGDTGSLGVATNRGYSPATLRRVNIIHYYADEEGRLMRRAFGVQQNGFVDSVVAEHITNLQFRYILKPSVTSTDTIFEQPRDQIGLGDSVRVRMIEPKLTIKTAYPLADGNHEFLDGVSQIGVRNVQFLEAPVPTDSQGNTTLPNPGPTPAITPTPTPQPTPTQTPIPTPTPVPTEST